MKTAILQKINLWLPPIIWMAIIFKFSSGSIPKASTIFWQDFAFKKIGHFLMFGVLATLIYRALIGEGISKKKSAIWAFIIALFYGITDEYHQLFTQGREPRIRDVFFDGIGAGFFIYLIYHFLQKLPKKVQSFLRYSGIE